MHEDHWTKRVVFVVRILFIRPRESVPLPVREKSVPECLFFFLILFVSESEDLIEMDHACNLTCEHKLRYLIYDFVSEVYIRL